MALLALGFFAVMTMVAPNAQDHQIFNCFVPPVVVKVVNMQFFRRAAFRALVRIVRERNRHVPSAALPLA